MNYTNFKQIEKDLTILKLRRKIAVEELRALKEVTANNLHVSSFLDQKIVKLLGKWGMAFLFKKIISKR